MAIPRSTTVVMLLACVNLALAAQEAVEPDQTLLIGMDPPALLAALGAPQQLLTQRGEAPEQDNVVFFYPDCRSVFWYRDRVWQVRFDRRYRGSVMGFSIGMDRPAVDARCGGRLETRGDSLYYTIDTLRFPLRLRLVIEADRVCDMYLYRSDF
jgi:hypothetical protein